MKTSELKRRVEELGYVLDKTVLMNAVVVKNKMGFGLCFVDEDEFSVIETNFKAFRDNLSNSEKAELFSLATEYAATPIEERKGEQKYRLKLNTGLNGINDDKFYINYVITEDIYELNDSENGEDYKTKFTQKEIDEMINDGKCNIDSFKKIEVEE